MSERFIGLMSGTSVDAVDGALVEIPPAYGPLRTLALASAPIPPALRAELLALQSPGEDELDRAARAGIALADLYAAVALQLAAQAAPSRVGAVGAHGQTVRHRPERGYTLQLIDGARLAERTGLDVVCDFRSADVAAGGQGAPLVPAFHAQVFASPTERRAIVNIGGIANVSLLAPGAPVCGHDTGPGNVLLDAWCEAHTGHAYDEDGRWAASGRVHRGLLDRLRADPYFARPAPKSTGRDLFNRDWLETALATLPAPPAAPDVQATLLELTASTIAVACRAFRAEQVFVCGGGARNRTLLRRLAELCAPARTATTEALGTAPQAVEAVAFAWLAACRLRGVPANLPEVTGARGRRVLGALYPAPPPA